MHLNRRTTSNNSINDKRYIYILGCENILPRAINLLTNKERTINLIELQSVFILHMRNKYLQFHVQMHCRQYTTIHYWKYLAMQLIQEHHDLYERNLCVTTFIT